MKHFNEQTDSFLLYAFRQMFFLSFLFYFALFIQRTVETLSVAENCII